MPPARGRGRGATARGKKSRGGSPAKATRTTVRQKQSEQLETRTADGPTTGEGGEDCPVSAGEATEGSVQHSGAQEHVDVAGEDNTANVNESEATDSQNMSVGKDELGSMSGGDAGTGKGDDTEMLQAESAEDDDILIATESETHDESVNEADIVIATESETLNDSANDADLTGAEDSESNVQPQNQGDDDENKDDQDGVGVEFTAEISAEDSGVNECTAVGDEGHVAVDESTMDESEAMMEGHVAVDESTMDESEAMMEGEEGMVDIDDFVVIDEDNGENTEHTEDEMERSEIEEKPVRFKETPKRKRGKKYRENHPQDTEKKEEIEERGNHIWQVRVYPVSMGTIRQMKDTWNDLCYTSISADFRLTVGQFAKGQVTSRLLESGMFQFLVTESKLQVLMRQIMKCRFPERHLRFEVRRIVLDKDWHHYDADFFDTLLGEVAYHKETAAKKEQEKSQSEKVSSGETSSAEKETTKQAAESTTEITNSETTEMTSNSETTEVTVDTETTEVTVDTKTTEVTVDSETTEVTVDTETTKVTTSRATDTTTETDSDATKVKSEVEVKMEAGKTETESADAEPQKLSGDSVAVVKQEPLSEDQEMSTGIEPCSSPKETQMDSKNIESTIKIEINLSQVTSEASASVGEMKENTDGDSSVMTDTEKEAQAEQATDAASTEPQSETNAEEPQTGSDPKQAEVAAGEGEGSAKESSVAEKPSDGGEAVKPGDAEDTEMAEQNIAAVEPVEREDPVSFRVNLNALSCKGLKHFRDARKSKEAATESPKKARVISEECQLVLKNLPEGVCDKTLAAIFPFARLIKRTKGEDGVCKAVFETASRRETDSYLDSYYTIFVNYEPVEIFGLFMESESYKQSKSKDKLRKRNRSRSHSRQPSSRGSPPSKRANISQRRESRKSSLGSQESSGRRLQSGQRGKVVRDGSTEAKMTARAGDVKLAPMKPAVSGTCRNCGRRGHYARDCQKPARMGSGNSSLTCRNCMQDGHLAKNCPLPRQQLDIARQAEDGARKLEELYARVVETQRNLTFMQQQAQMGIPPSRPGSMMGNMPGNMPGNLPGNMPGNMPVNMGGNMPGPSYGMGGAFSGIPQGRPYGMGTQMGMNMGMQYGSVPQQSPGDWQGQGQDKQYPQQLQQHENVYIRRQ